MSPGGETSGALDWVVLAGRPALVAVEDDDPPPQPAVDTATARARSASADEDVVRGTGRSVGRPGQHAARPRSTPGQTCSAASHGRVRCGYGRPRDPARRG